MANKDNPQQLKPVNPSSVLRPNDSVLHAVRLNDLTATFDKVTPLFLDYIRYDLNFSPATVQKYEESIGWVVRFLDYLAGPEQISFRDVTILRRKMFERNMGPARMNSIIYALRKFLAFCREVCKLEVMHQKEITAVKLPKREVIFLTIEEIVKIRKCINTKDKRGLRMRTLFEVLLGTGMRISEALSLNCDSIDWPKREANIIGKGNKERTVFFTEECLDWLNMYLDSRKDTNSALFVTTGKRPKRLTRCDLSKQFALLRKKSGINKKLTPHILRHTFATMISNNGGDIRVIQQLLGHADIDTTARYYCGTDKSKLKEAHNKYLKFA